jgi:predicted dehydrogenase
MDAPPLRWGVLGTGWIAGRFAAALRASTRQQVYAVGSRSLSSATTFAETVGAPRAYGSYQDLVADDSLDVVYVATPHNHHHPHARLAMEAGRHVVVEKPMGVSAAEARDLAGLAAERGLFLMEALWTFFLPKLDVIRRLVEDGVLGTPHSVVADIGEYFAAEHRIMRADLAGGPMNDLMTYPASLATWLLGSPFEVAAVSSVAPKTLSPSGVDGQVAAVLRTHTGAVASLTASVLGDLPTTASVVGSQATLLLDRYFYRPGGFTLLGHGGKALRWHEEGVDHAALFWQAAEVARRIAAGETVTPLRTPADTITTLETMDAIRAAAQRSSTTISSA